MLELQGISKTIGRRTILEAISFSLAPGRFLAVFGPNGAGKSTLLRIISGLIPPSSGRLAYAGQPVNEAAVAYRGRIGFLSHKTFLYDNLSAYENLLFYGRMYEVPRLEERIEELLLKVGLDLFRNDPVRSFSRGMQQRLAIARALIHEPELLLLDEPYTGLDQQAAELLVDLLREFKARGVAAIIVSHDFERGLVLADEYLLLDRGRVVTHGEAAAINEAWLKERFRALGGSVR